MHNKHGCISESCVSDSEGILDRAVARTLIGGGGGCIFIYSGSA